MFYDQENCRAFRLLCEASSFLEASLEKLLALEKEALAERDKQIENATGGNITSSKKIEKKVDLNLEATLGTVDNENICNCNSESCDHKCVSSQKIKLSSQSSPDKTVNSTKRKYGTIVFNDDKLENTIHEEKKIKTQLTESNKNHLSTEIHKKNMNSDDESSDSSSSTLTDSTANHAAAPQDQIHPDPQPTEITLLEEYFKVCIIFKERLQYETVEELIKSVGLEDVFDIVLTKKKAEVTFLNKNSMKKALSLPPAALNKLKASTILPVE